jgi:catechol 2,3-dioxygenase-like lactoylglutathione lyase family enzyme
MTETEETGPVPMGALIAVASLSRSVDFYTEILQFGIVWSEDQVAILGPKNGGTSLLTLRELGPSHTHAGGQSVGVRGLFWQCDSKGSLAEIEKALVTNHAFVRRIAGSGDSETVVGLDPDRIALGFTASCDNSQRSVGHLAEIPPLAYAIDG